jgi:GT2 family glycosyltransferase
LKFVRVIILNYGSASYTVNIVKSVLNQSYSNLEIIVVDNFSNEENVIYLEQYLPDSVVLLLSKINGGYSAGNNIGMKYKSRNEIEYFLILNNDLILNDNLFVEKLVKTYTVESNRKIIAVSPLVNTMYNKIDPGYQIQCRRLLSPFYMFVLSFSFLKRIFKDKSNESVYADLRPYNDKYLFTDTINGAAFMIDSTFMLNNNYLDENVFLFFEELILGNQIKNINGTCILNGFITVDHFQGVSTNSNKGSFNINMEQIKINSEVYLFQKYYHFNKSIIAFFILLKKFEIRLKYIYHKIL